MAPTTAAAVFHELHSRAYYCNAFGTNCYYTRSGWYNWGRWLLLGLLILAALLFVFMLSCIRRRRIRRGVPAPRYAPGWMGAKQHQQQWPNNGQQQGYGDPNYNGNNGYYQPAPPYTPAGGQHGLNQGYYGQQNGVELQQPSQAYQRGGENVYEPPTGPPPKK